MRSRRTACFSIDLAIREVLINFVREFLVNYLIMNTKRIFTTIVASLMLCICANAQKVFMAGDSHIALKTYPQTLGAILEEEMPGVEFDSFGIGGAGFYTYVDKPKNMVPIYEAQPDILIIALGTNDCNNWYYSASKLRERATRMYNMVKERLPECKIVFVTPFYFKTKKVRGHELEINPNVEASAETLASLAETLPDVWTINLVPDHGMDFLNGDLMRKDFIHLTNDGYRHLARIVADGLLSQAGLFDITPSQTEPEN